MTRLLFIAVLSSLPDAGNTYVPANPGDLTEIAPPIPGEDRLHPDIVVLEYRRMGEDDSTWVSDTVNIPGLTRFWGDGMREYDPLALPCAPAPITREQALELPVLAADWGRCVWLRFGEHDLVYSFDDLGRTVQVEWDPAADSGVYLFDYYYGVNSLSPPVWRD